MKRIITALMCVLSFFISKGQASPDEQHISHKQFQSVVPQSPNAASLGKYGEIPVGMYTGIPSISIPLYEINTGKLSLPITLSYHAAGIRVEEIASWAGLGWSVSVGGQVTRQIRGLPDESAHGYLTEFRKIREVTTMSAEERRVYFDQIEAGELDAEPDVFSYSAGNISGEFFFDTSGNIVTNPLSKIQISGLNGWQITDNSGNRYYFTAPEFTMVSFLTNNAVSSNFSSGVTAWLLTKIENATGTDSINFEYENNVTHFTTIASQTRYHFVTGGARCKPKGTTNHSSVNEVNGYRLKKIKFKNGEILFNKAGDPRLDVPDDYPLESIVIRSANDQFYKKYQLHHHYAASSGAPGTYSLGYKEYYRLMLDSISIYDAGSVCTGRYKYNYNAPELLPNRLSYDQDYWGYYNGANNAGNFAPSVSYQLPPPAWLLTYPGANRKPSSTYSQTGMLNKITYPTGGYSEFEFEQNKALSPKSYEDGQTGSMSLGSSLNGGTVFTSPMFHISYCGNTIVNPQVNIQITANMGSCPPEQNLECPLVYIKDSASNASWPVTASGIGVLPADRTYYLTADLSNVTDTLLFQNFFVMVTWQACSFITIGNQNYYEVTAGGHRVKKITLTDPVSGTSQVTRYEYKKPGNSYSSGFLVSFPEYVGTIQESHKERDEAMGSIYVYDCDYLTVSSSSNYPLLSTRGGTVGYSFVTETESMNGNNGKKEFTYISPFETPDIVDYSFPYAPATSFEWRRGYPLNEKVYKGATGAYSLVSEKRYTYAAPLAFNQDGLKNGRRHFFTYDLPGYTDNDYQYTIYSQSSGLFLPVKDTTITYPADNSSQVMMAVNEYNHNLDNYAVNETKTKGAAGKTSISKTRYPGDYNIAFNNNNPVPAGIRNLTGYNLLNIPVEQYTIQRDANGAEYVVGGVITQFYADRPLPEKIFVLKTNAPVPIGSFTVSTVDGSGNFIKDSHYTEEVLFNGYDAQANLKGQQKANNVQLSYLYDYKNSLPIAQAVNAVQEDIAYTSFEADGRGGWTFTGTPAVDNTAPTGSKSYSLVYNPITKSLSSSKTYIASFWKNGTVSLSNGALYRTGRTINGWTYVEYEISSASGLDITGTGKIDELRLYPKNAQMTTYTYEPLLGITSQSDVNGNIAYYEYDTLGRLKFIKDTDKNVIKAMEYKYQAGVTE